MVDNPWNVDSIDAFIFLKCPECVYDTKEEHDFRDHAFENHPMSFVFFGKKIKEESYDEVKQENYDNLDGNHSDNAEIYCDTATSEYLSLPSIYNEEFSNDIDEKPEVESFSTIGLQNCKIFSRDWMLFVCMYYIFVIV